STRCQRTTVDDEILPDVDGYQTGRLYRRAAVKVEGVGKVIGTRAESELTVSIDGKGSVIARRHVDRDVRTRHVQVAHGLPIADIRNRRLRIHRHIAGAICRWHGV